MIKKYDQYKDSGVEWIGKIPSSWETIKIKWTTPVKRGASPRPIADPQYFDDHGEFAWVRISDVTASERYLDSTTDQLSELGASLSVKQFPGDLFLSIAGSVGKPIITKIKCCIHDGFVWFPEIKINPEYLFYLFQSGLPFIGLGKVGTQLNLNTETIGNIQIPVSSNQEVNRIVEYLDHQTSLIDTITKKKQQLIEKLKEQRQAIINETVTKGLNPDALMKESGVEWLGEIPEHWGFKKLKYVGEVNFSSVDRHQFDDEIKVRICHYPDAYKNEKITMDTIISEGTCTASEFEKFQLKKGQILITKDSESADDIGVPAFIENDFENGVCGYHLAIINSCKENIFSEYLFRFFQTNNVNTYFETNANGVTRFGLGKSTIQNLVVPIPPIEEQVDLINYLNKRLEVIKKTNEGVVETISKLKGYRQSIISEAVTGKIDVREWEPKTSETV